MPSQIHLVLLETDIDTEIQCAFLKHANAADWLHDFARNSTDPWERLTDNGYRRLLDDNHQETLWIHSIYIEDAHE